MPCISIPHWFPCVEIWVPYFFFMLLCSFGFCFFYLRTPKSQGLSFVLFALSTSELCTPEVLRLVSFLCVFCTSKLQNPEVPRCVVFNCLFCWSSLELQNPRVLGWSLRSCFLFSSPQNLRTSKSRGEVFGVVVELVTCGPRSPKLLFMAFVRMSLGGYKYE